MAYSSARTLAATLRTARARRVMLTLNAQEGAPAMDTSAPSATPTPSATATASANAPAFAASAAIAGIPAHGEGAAARRHPPATTAEMDRAVAELQQRKAAWV